MDRGFLAAFVVWSVPIGLMMQDGGTSDDGPIGLQLVSDFGFVLACAGGCFFVAGVSLRFARRRWAWLDNLSDNAYGMFLIHYVFVVWLQYALLDAALLRHRQGGDRVRRNGACELGCDDRHAPHSARRLASRGATPRGAPPRRQDGRGRRRGGRTAPTKIIE